jgi:hypothetical protein
MKEIPIKSKCVCLIILLPILTGGLSLTVQAGDAGKVPPGLAELDRQEKNEVRLWKRDYGKNGKVMETDLWVRPANKDRKPGDPAVAAETRQWHAVKSAKYTQKTTLPGVRTYTLTPANRLAPANKAATTAKAASAQEIWLMAKKAILSPSVYICTFKRNIFGQVIDLTDTSVRVQLIGQASIIRDGIIYSAADGLLFATDEPISFLPLEGSHTFSLSEVAVCYPQ